MKTIIKNIIASLENFKDADRIEFAKKSYPTAMKIIGVTVPNEKFILKELKTQIKSFSEKEKIELAKELVNTNIFECQHMAYEFIGSDKKVLNELTEKDINDLGKNLDNWVSVDSYGVYLVGYAWREKKIPDKKIHAYLKSDDFWIRRIALVATVSLNQKARGGTGDTKRTLEVCEKAINDHKDMINKALSWALRELAKIHKEPVKKFIEKYKDTLHSRVLREVSNKIKTGTKN